jgi:hypothetical protein
MTVVHTYFYIVVDTQGGCHTLKLRKQEDNTSASYVQFQESCGIKHKGTFTYCDCTWCYWTTMGSV